MGKPHKIDWGKAYDMYCSGTSLIDISKHLGVSYACVRAHSSRYKWSTDGGNISRVIIKSVPGWSDRVANSIEERIQLLERNMSLDMASIEKLVEILERLQSCHTKNEESIRIRKEAIKRLKKAREKKALLWQLRFKAVKNRSPEMAMMYAASKITNHETANSTNQA